MNCQPNMYALNTRDCVVLCSYFKQPWAMAIFHDRFSDFRDEVRELLVSRPVRTLYFILFTDCAAFCLRLFE